MILRKNKGTLSNILIKLAKNEPLKPLKKGKTGLIFESRILSDFVKGYFTDEQINSFVVDEKLNFSNELEKQFDNLKKNYIELKKI